MLAAHEMATNFEEEWVSNNFSLTGQWIHSYSGTHLLKVTSKLCILAYVILVFGGELLQAAPEGVQLAGQVRQLQVSYL